MNDQIVFSYVRTGAENKQIKKDDKGYYFITLGAFNAYNRSGAFYLMDGVRDLVENKSSSLNRRIRDGYLKGEAGHPNYETGMSKVEFYERNLKIEQTRISHHIRDIVFTDTKTPCGMPGKGNIVLVQAWLKPDGPMGDALKKSLDDPEQNVAFSIRCFTKDEMVNGTVIKQVVQIVTWDWVVEPGMKMANKFDTLNLESLDFTPISLRSLREYNNELSISTESADINVMLDDIERNISKHDINTNNSVLAHW